MNMKGVVLGVAGALAVTGVQAADLAVAPEPVDYVRVCDAFGTGFLYVPGTETCFQIRGRIRADYRFAITGQGNFGGVNYQKRNQNAYNFRARAYFYSDSRTNTEYGLLRTFAQLEIQTQTGTGGASTVNLDQAFIQFGGLTFGKAYSFFDFYQTPNFFAPFEPAHSDQNTLMAAYTFAFGNGFSASISIEDNLYRQGFVWDRPAVPGPFNQDGYAGVRWPDLVGNIRVDQGWGSAQLMGALHEVRARRSGGSELGWAIAGGVVVNLPMLAEGDTFGLQAGYSSGAVSYVAPNAWGPGGNGQADGRLFPGSNDLKLTSAWSIAAGFQHFWAPNVSSGFGVSYLDVDVPGKRFDFQNWDLQGNIVFTPVAGLETGFELQYKTMQPGGNGKSDKDMLVGTFRVQRSF
jgi:hypothetical protein